MKHILRWAAYQLTRKKIDEKELSPLQIRLDSQDISFFQLSTNPIISFDYDGKRHYFRECPKLMGRRAFFLEEIDAFFCRIGRLGIDPRHFKQEIPIPVDFSQEEVRSFRDYLRRKREDAGFLKRLYDADRIGEKRGFSIWEAGHHGPEHLDAFGLADRPAGTDDIGIYFLWCMRSCAIRYRTLRIARGKEWSYWGAVRAISSRILAQELGVEHLITDAQLCELETEDGRRMRGVLSEEAPGERMIDASVTASGPLQRALGELFLLDLLAFQSDHGPNNYNVAMGPEGPTVCAFDNDNPMTFFPSFSIACPLAGCSPAVDAAGLIHRPYLSQSLVTAVRNADLRRLDARLRPYLGWLQRQALRARIRKFRAAVDRTEQRRGPLLLRAEDWDRQTVDRELDGSYGITYLTKIG